MMLEKSNSENKNLMKLHKNPCKKILNKPIMRAVNICYFLS